MFGISVRQRRKKGGREVKGYGYEKQGGKKPKVSLIQQIIPALTENLKNKK